MNPGTKPSGMDNLTSEEIWRVAERRAKDEGALKPQNLIERAAAGPGAYTYGPGWFAEQPLAQSRLRQWTMDILRAWGYTLVDR
jgi:hypothetical protein